MPDMAKTKELDEYQKSVALVTATDSSGMMLRTLTQAEIDSQIALAQQRPRQLSVVMKNIETLATLDEETAEECMYALPRGGKPIKGASIRLAEIIQQQWRNNRAGSRVIAIDKANKVVVAEGIFHDLETNSQTRKEVSRRISDKNGRLFNDDMINMTGNAACAIALRNAILAGVPKGIWRRAYEACERVVAGDIATLAERRDKAFKAFAAFGVKPEQLFAVLEVKGIEDITLAHIPALIAMHNALKAGETTVQEMFDPRRVAAGGFEVVANPLKDDAPAKSDDQKQPASGASPNAGEEAADAPAGGEQAAGDQKTEATARGPAAAEHTIDQAAVDQQTAYRRGRDDRAAGRARRAIPGEYRDAAHQREAVCWQAGFDGNPMPMF